MIQLSDYAKLLNKSNIQEAFDNIYSFLLNPEYADMGWNELIRKFELNGGKVLGQGKNATVMEHPSWKYVLKVFNNDDPYVKFVRFALKNPRSSFPVFYDKPRKIVPHFKRYESQPYLYIVKTEKLYPINRETFKDIEYYLYYNYEFIDDMIARYSHDDDKENMWIEMKQKLEMLESKYPSLPQFKKDYNFLMNSSNADASFGELDLHVNNIMKRANGELVLIDPFWAGESLHKMQNKAIDAERDPSYDTENPMIKGGKLPKRNLAYKKQSPKYTQPDYSVSYGDDFPIFEQQVDKEEYERRYKFIQAYVDKLVDDAPGKNREEKLTYVWNHHKETMNKLMGGMRAIGKAATFGRIGDEHPDSYKSKFTADKYYIRFGDFPKGGKSKNYATGEMEIGVSAYPAKWNIQKNKWEIIENQLEEFAALDSLTYEIKIGEGRTVYLVQGQELNDLGSDGEPMLDINKVKIVKQLQPDEFFSRELGEDWYIQ
jgi:hypothetical protein